MPHLVGRLAGLILAVVLVAAVLASAGARAGEFEAWREGFRREALERGIAAATIDRALAGVAPIPRVIELDRRQPEFTQTFWRYIDSRVTPERIARGRALLAEHRDLLGAVERRYGVQPRFLVAFWGLESNFGDYTGTFPLIGALATLAFDERRSAFFREQLFAALEIVERGDVAADAKASWAGALGQSQFIPTTYRRYAVDFDGDGKRDLWTSLADVFASSAHYLSASGWRDDLTWGREVRLPEGFDLGETGLDAKRPLAEWQARGVRRVDGRDLPRVDVDGAIVLPGGYDGGPALMVYQNFRTTLVWNRSILYAVSVGYLADRIAGRPPFATPRVAKEVPLSRSEVQEMQRLLAAAGHDPGGADGVAGPRTRDAIRAFQSARRLPADGHPSIGVLERLRAVARP